MQATLLLGPDDLANPMLLEGLVMGKYPVWHIGEAWVGVAQHRPLAFGNKAMPSATEIYMFFEKEFLVC